jgi:large subunit ribosomal protein L31e
MADKSTTEIERIYTIPLRRAKAGTRSKRADRAVRDVRDFLTRHMKSEQIWLSNEVNETLWSRGKYMIPSRIRVRATRFNDGVVEVTLPEQEAAGSIRAQIQERQEKAAETPVLAPMVPEEDEDEEHVHASVPVTAVKGIGPAMAEKLAAIGVETAADLAHADPAEVAEATGHHEEAVQGWIAEASELAHSHGDDSEEE